MVHRSPHAALLSCVSGAPLAAVQVRRWPTRLDSWLQDWLDRRVLAPVRAKPDFRPTLRALGVNTAAPTGESGQLLIHKSR